MNAPGIGGSGEIEGSAFGGMLAIVIYDIIVEDSPQGSFAVTLTCHVCPGSSLSSGTNNSPSNSGTVNPLRVQKMSKDTGSESRSVAEA